MSESLVTGHHQQQNQSLLEMEPHFVGQVSVTYEYTGKQADNSEVKVVPGEVLHLLESHMDENWHLVLKLNEPVEKAFYVPVAFVTRIDNNQDPNPPAVLVNVFHYDYDADIPSPTATGSQSSAQQQPESTIASEPQSQSDTGHLHPLSSFTGDLRGTTFSSLPTQSGVDGSPTARPRTKSPSFLEKSDKHHRHRHEASSISEVDTTQQQPLHQPQKQSQHRRNLSSSAAVDMTTTSSIKEEPEKNPKEKPSGADMYVNLGDLSAGKVTQDVPKDPPPVSQRPADLTDHSNSEWVCEKLNDGSVVFTNRNTKAKWFQASDEEGNIYYHDELYQNSVWQLQDVTQDVSPITRQSQQPLPPGCNTKSLDLDSVFPPVKDKTTKVEEPRGSRSATLPTTTRSSTESTSSEVGVKPRPQISQPTGVNGTFRRAQVNKCRYSENGKVLKKRWATSFLLLTGPQLFFYRDQKSSQAVSNNNFGKPELFLETKNLHFSKLTPADKITKKLNVIKVEDKGAPGSCIVYLLQFITPIELDSCFTALNLCKNWVNAGNIYAPTTVAFNRDGKPGDENKGSIISHFLSKRPTKESLEAKGIYKNERVFGSTLAIICQQEKTTVPHFVTACIESIEHRGLDHVGIYRVNGNGALIQKLRMQVDQSDKIDLNSNKIEFEVLTGALKLFFRELQEPVIPFNFCAPFIAAVNNQQSASAKRATVKKLLAELPTVNHDTLTVLFQHLHRVLARTRENQMQTGSLAMCFGPNLLWPEREVELEALAQSLVERNRVVEFLLQEAEFLFS